MSDLLEEKYVVASILTKLDLFTLEDLKKEIRNDQMIIAADIVVQDLLQIECIAESQHEALIFNSKLLDFFPTTKTVYTIIPERRLALDKYIEELEIQRFHPDTWGKPRGLHFRIVEGLLEDFLANSGKPLPERASLIEYFALAQEEEMAEHLDLRQREVSEAYIRMLYGEFLILESLWEDAILQLLTASQLFKAYILEDMHKLTEEKATHLFREIFVSTYIKATENQTPEQINALLKVQESAEKIKQLIPHDEQIFVQFFLSIEECLQEVEVFTHAKPPSQNLVSPSREQSLEINITKPTNVVKVTPPPEKEMQEMLSRVEKKLYSVQKNINERDRNFEQRKDQYLNEKISEISGYSYQI